MPPSNEAAWQEKLAALHAHVAAHGRLPPFNHGPGLSGWIAGQRAAKRAADAGKAGTYKMTPERVAALEAVPGWAWGEGAEARWLEKLAALRAHVAEHGRLPPCERGPGLGGWIAIQRTAKNAADAGEPRGNKMTPERAAALEAVPGWTWEPREASWEEKLAALRAHVAVHGQLPSHSHPSRLGVWVDTQRSAKRGMDAGRRGGLKMTPARVAALEGVPGWAWEADVEAGWREKLTALEAFVAEHGRLPAPRHPSGLGAWVQSQRTAKRAADTGRACRNKMTPQRAAALAAVPGWVWEVRKRARE